jgi:uncharacterized protein YecE (DUF72 family)
VQFYVGTSGYSYKEWKGNFYPDKLAAKDMLAYYAEHLPSVEINNTFYRMPKASVLETWASQVPESFRFVLKASQRITHRKRLKDAGEEVRYLWDTALTLGDRLGVILFQLPPSLRKDADRLGEFLRIVPDPARAAFEFRHDSWFDDEIHDVLHSKGAALCVADTGDDANSAKTTAPDTMDAPTTNTGTDDGVTSTTSWGYLRLRRERYADDELRAWVRRIRRQDWTAVYVFFKHEDDGAGPEMASRFLAMVRS